MKKTYESFDKNNIINFLSENTYLFLFSSLTIILTYYKQMHTLNIGIDTEVLINNPTTGYINWLDMGRQGAIFTRFILEGLNFNPYYSGIISLILLIISMIALAYIFYDIGDLNPLTSVFIFLTFIIHPIWVEQFYFTLQILPVTFAILCTFIATYTTYYGVIHNNKLFYLISTILIIWTTSTYQSFILLYISLVVSLYILYYKKNISNSNLDFKHYIYVILKSIAICLISFAINQIITNIFFMDGMSKDYILNQILWKKIPITDAVKNILNHIMSVLTTNSVRYGNLAYLLSIIVLAISLVFDRFNKNKNKLMNLIYYLAIFFLQICPFLLTIYMANEPSLRTQFVLPFVIAFNIGLSVELHKEKKIHIISFIIIVWLFVFMNNLKDVSQLQYTGDIMFNSETALADRIYDDLDRNINLSKPVAFIGLPTLKLNRSAIYHGEMIGISFFHILRDLEPRYYHTTFRIIGLMNALGYDINCASPEQIIEARKVACDMTVWPKDGSILETDDFVVVKLGQDDFYLDDFDLKPKVIEMKNIQFVQNDFNWFIDNFDIYNEKVSINGWLVNPNIISNGDEIKVCLYDDKSSIGLELPTVYSIRQDVDNYLSGSGLYRNSGFKSLCKISYIEKYGKLEDYKLILKYTKNKKDIYIDTGKYIER